LDIWTFGHLDIWTFGHLDIWTFGHLLLLLAKCGVQNFAADCVFQSVHICISRSEKRWGIFLLLSQEERFVHRISAALSFSRVFYRSVASQGLVENKELNISVSKSLNRFTISMNRVLQSDHRFLKCRIQSLMIGFPHNLLDKGEEFIRLVE
jgi:hypothetical protein